MFFNPTASLALLITTHLTLALANPAPAPTQPTGAALASAQISYISAIENYASTRTTGAAYKSEQSVLATNSAWATASISLATPKEGVPYSDPGAVYTSQSKALDTLPTDAGGRQFVQNEVYDEFSIYQSAFQTTFLPAKNGGGQAIATPAPALRVAGVAVGILGAAVAVL